MLKSKLNFVLFAGILFSLLLFSSNSYAQSETGNGNNVKHGPGFVDANGDGYNDNAPDVDNDGIPNGQDPDYTGPKIRKGGKGFVDEDGDGINDNAVDSDNDGIPNGQDPDYVKPKDGSGRKFQRGSRNTIKTHNQERIQSQLRIGECDGTGPKGNRRDGKK